MNQPAYIQLAQLRLDGGTQSRVALNELVVAEYADAYSAGSELPPVVAYFDGSTYWLADGFHRYMAAKKLGRGGLDADIRTGTRRDAVLYSVGANSAHGLPRTNADKRRAVETLLADEEWAAWSDREIARRCCVSHEFVGKVRQPICQPLTDAPRKVERNGTVYIQRTENIGKRPGNVDHYTGRIGELVAGGNSAEQVADRLGLQEVYVRRLAGAAGIEFPVGTNKMRRINHTRVIEETVMSLEASASALRTIPPDTADLSPEQAAEWAQSVTDSIKTFTAFRNQLRNHANA